MEVYKQQYEIDDNLQGAGNKDVSFYHEPLQSSPLKVLVMAGGRGRRVESITQGLIPKDFLTVDRNQKIRGIDYVHSILRNLKLNDVTYSANFYYDLYRKTLRNTPYKLHFQQEGDNHGSDLYKIILEHGVDSQLLVLPTDMYFDPLDLKKLIQVHRPGSLTWAVTSYQYEDMEPYRTLMVNATTYSVQGDTKSPWWRDNGISCEPYVGGGIVMIDPKVYLKGYEAYTRLNKKHKGIDMYREILYLVAEQNRRRITKGDESIFYACIFDKPMIDYGTPERLELTREVFSSTYYAKI